MNKITELTSKAIAVTIPPEGNINNSYLWGYTNQWWVRYVEITGPGRFATREIKLPEGTWAIEGVGNNLTEEQWKGIVDQQRGGGKFRHYDIEGSSLAQYGSYMLNNATESGLSLLKSKGLNPESIIILIKQ